MGVVGFWLHFTRVRTDTVVSLAAFAPYLMAVALGGLLLGAVLRAWWLTAAGVVVVLVSTFTQVPLYLPSRSGGPSELTVLQFNLMLGQAEVSELADLVRREHVDVLTVTELTAEALAAVEASPITDDLRYSYTQPARAGNGGGVFSRFPIVERRRLDGFWLPNLRTVIAVPRKAPLAVYGLHVMPPYPNTSAQWRSELTSLREDLVDEQLPVIVSGDFNATHDHRAYRALTAVAPGRPGMIDAAEHTGAGMVPTYPADRFFPPLLALDRMLSRGGPEPVEFRRIRVAGSDHYAVVGRFRGLPPRR